MMLYNVKFSNKLLECLVYLFQISIAEYSKRIVLSLKYAGSSWLEICFYTTVHCTVYSSYYIIS